MPDVLPVEVTNPDPLRVEETSDQPRDVNIVGDSRHDPDAARVAASARVDADVLRTADQRRISSIWERTQQIIALSVVLTSLAVSAFLTIADPKGNSTTFVFLASVANLVIGFYFGRTNHQRVGGDTDPGPVLGR